MKYYFQCLIIILSISLFSSLNLTFQDKLINNTLTTSIKNIKNDDDHPCEKKTGMLLKFLLNQSSLPAEYNDYLNMAIFSGTFINDWGDYQGCKEMTYSNYHMANYKIINEASAKGITVQLGLCYFKECDVNYLNKAKNDLVKLLNVTKGISINPDNLFFVDPEENQKDWMRRSKTGFTIVASVILLLIVLSILQLCVKNRPKKKSLLYDIDEERRSRKSFLENESNNSESPSAFHKVLQLFDFGRNASKIFEIKTNLNNTHVVLRVFDGVRFFSLAWVVFGHTIFIASISGFKNMADILVLSKTWTYSFLLSAFYAVDIFFFMSGFLLYFTLQKHFNKNINRVQLFFHAIFHRYIRLLSLYLFIIIGLTYILPFIGSGPIYEKAEMFNKTCPKYFWHNLLYINNLYKYSIEEPMCAGHTWYLANDMQFFLLALIIFLLLNNKKFLRNIIFTLIFIGSSAWSIYDVYFYNYRYMVDFTHRRADMATFFDNYYIKPWNRINPYLLGIFFCEFFLETPVYINDYIETTGNESKEEVKISYIRQINNFFIKSNIACAILFILSLILLFATFFTPVLVNNYDLPIFYHAMFNAFNKNIFVFAVGCITHLTFLGKLAIIRNTLSLTFFNISARISYGTYLLHIYLLTLFFCGYESLTYLKLGDYFYFAIGFMTFSLVLSFIFTVLMDGPMINGMKLLQESKNKKEIKE